FQQANLAGMVVDECHDSDQIETYLHQLAGNTIEFSIGNYFTPPTFLGTGSHKVFRDEIFGKIRFICQADHRYYIKNNLYDFPHKNYKNRMFNVLMTFLTKIPKFRKELYKRAEVEMCKPYQKVVERV
ncbi:MAG: flavodoxin, partial [Proteobacteria bacterium]|nr:flavodoxin [Pseudomonadota bacterium]